MAKGIEDSPIVQQRSARPNTNTNTNTTTTTTSSATTITTNSPYQPSAPPIILNSSDNLPNLPENQVGFLVNNVRCGPYDRNFILTANKELARVISSGNSNSINSGNGYYTISHPSPIDSKDFQSIIEFLETKRIIFKDIDEALRKLEFAKRFQCSALLRKCVQYLDLNLTTTNIIQVYGAMRFHVVNETPKKIPLEKKTPAECLDALMYNVLQFIDQYADIVLQRDEILDARLNFSEIEMILRREHLMTSEVVIYNLLGKWSRQQCENRGLEVTSENRRRMLGSLCYVPRYLLMTQKEFELACQRVEILDSDEEALVKEAFNKKGKPSANLNKDQVDMLSKFKMVRPKCARLPIHLSDRSYKKNFSSKMRAYERSLDDENQGTWLYWLCGCYAFCFD